MKNLREKTREGGLMTEIYKRGKKYDLSKGFIQTLFKGEGKGVFSLKRGSMRTLFALSYHG